MNDQHSRESLTGIPSDEGKNDFSQSNCRFVYKQEYNTIYKGGWKDEQIQRSSSTRKTRIMRDIRLPYDLHFVRLYWLALALDSWECWDPT